MQLSTQVLGIAPSSDGRQLRVSRIARGKHGAALVLDAQSLEEAPAADGPWLPVATLENGFTSPHWSWRVGEFGAGLFAQARHDSKPKALPPPFNDPALTVTAFAISLDEHHALVGNSSGFVSVFDTHTGDEVFAQRLHRGHVTAAAFAPDGRHAYTGSAAGELCRLTLP
ncbi:MAG: hypothetical protein CFE45_19110 [Burkholderiales bacterium PBB5]|nr:MAG: hypothetical protein CFE45_19110 [Burkholderiales bacterium PBB5]